jgi:hypothetical protein
MSGQLQLTGLALLAWPTAFSAWPARPLGAGCARRALTARSPRVVHPRDGAVARSPVALWRLAGGKVVASHP